MCVSSSSATASRRRPVLLIVCIKGSPGSPSNVASKVNDSAPFALMRKFATAVAS